MFRRAVHPGAILADELAELGVPPAVLAQRINVPADYAAAIIAGQKPVTPDLALRLGHWFGVAPQFWMNLQEQHDRQLAAAAPAVAN